MGMRWRLGLIDWLYILVHICMYTYVQEQQDLDGGNFFPPIVFI